MATNNMERTEFEFPDEVEQKETKEVEIAKPEFKIQKEEASSAGVRRIKAVLM